MNYGEFCKLYGKTLRNKILEHILELDNLDFAVSDILEFIDISKPKLYQIIKELEKEKIIKKSRIISNTQLYKLNKSNINTKLLIDSFNRCINKTLEKTIVDKTITNKLRKLIDQKQVIVVSMNDI